MSGDFVKETCTLFTDGYIRRVLVCLLLRLILYSIWQCGDIIWGEYSDCNEHGSWDN